MPHAVVALVYDGLCSFEYGIAAEVFALSRPELDRQLYTFSSVALEKKPLRAAGGLTFKASGILADLNKAQTIVIPGWRGKDYIVPDSICRQLRKADSRGARFLGICSGTYVLAAAGLLKSKRATTHWRYAKDLRIKYPDIDVDESKLYVEDGNIVTSAGSSAGLDACLHIVRKDYGTEVANNVARRLVIHAYRQGSQAQFIEQPLPKLGGDTRLCALIDKVRSNLSAQYQIESLAQHVGMSSRTFQRRFVDFTGTTVIKWLIQERVARATELLESTDLSIDRIGQEVGFNSADTLRYHYRMTYEISPNEYRKRFRLHQK